MSEPVTNIVLVGRTGNGKSATGNTILGKKMFFSRLQAGGVTMECEMYRAAIQDGPIVNVIDTPGLLDSSVSEEYISTQIIRCLTMAEDGIHAMLFVLSTRKRISQEEESTLKTLLSIFDSKILDYFIVVFTGGDELEEDGNTLDDYFRQGVPEFLTTLLRHCGGRMVLFNNRTTDKDKKADQLKRLLVHVEAVRHRNGGKPYTDQMHHQIKESKKLAAEAEAAEDLKLEYDEKMRRMKQILERKLKKNSEANEKAIREMRETLLVRPPEAQVRPPRNNPVFHPFPQYRAPPPGCNLM